jgi:hypothetical protein
MRTALRVTALSGLTIVSTAQAGAPSLWTAYNATFRHAKYIDLTHTIAPDIPVWHGFGRSKFAPTINPATGKP